MKRLIFAGLASILASHALAWTSVAANGNRTYVAYNFATPQEATDAALKGCQENTGSECRTMDSDGAVLKTATGSLGVMLKNAINFCVECFAKR